MADFTLSTQRLPPPSAEGQLNAPLSKSTTYVNPQAGNVGIYSGRTTATDVKIAPITKDKTPQAVQNFINTVSSEAFKYQEREAQLHATQAINAYETRLSERYLNNPDQLTGDALYEPFAASAKADFNATLESLDPRVRNKALVGMFASQSKFLRKAAERRAKHHQEALDFQRYKSAEHYAGQFAMDPASAEVPDPETGLSVKDKFLQQFPDKIKGQEAWYDIVQAKMELLYLDNGGGAAGLAAATAFYNTIGLEQFGNSPKHMSKALTWVQRWDRQAVRDANSASTAEIRRREFEVSQTHANTSREFTTAELLGQPPSQEEMARRVVLNEWDPKSAIGMTQRVYGGKYKRADPERILHWEQRLLRASQTNFIIDGKDVRNGFNADPGIYNDNATISRLVKYQERLNDPNFGNRLNNLKSAMSPYIEGNQYTRDYRVTEIEAAKSQFSFDAQAGISQGLSDAEIIHQGMVRYNSYDKAIGSLPLLRDGSRPQSVADVKLKMGELAGKYQGDMKNPAFTAEALLLMKYRDAYQAKDDFDGEGE